MKVCDLMTKKPATCSSLDSLVVAAHLMWEHDCGAIVVVEGEKPVGVITDRDICMAAYTQGLPLHDMKVATAASKLFAPWVPKSQSNASMPRCESGSSGVCQSSMRTVSWSASSRSMISPGT